MERFLDLVRKGVGPQYWTALGRTRGAKGHQALQHMSLMADPETRFRVELAYANKDRFIVERYLSMMRAMPPSPELASDTRMDRWTDAMADWADDALKARAEVHGRLSEKWATLFRDCYAEQFMPYALAQLWDDTDGVDLYGLMAIGMSLIRYRQLDSVPDEDMLTELTQLRSVIMKSAKTALGGAPRATWWHGEDDVYVRTSMSRHWVASRNRNHSVDPLIGVATKSIEPLPGGYSELSEILLIDFESHVKTDSVWLRRGPTALRDAERRLDDLLAKIKRFHRRPVLCPLHAEAYVEREMSDLDNDPDGCWTATIAGYLVALAGEALTTPRVWYTERDLRDHVDRCSTPKEWRPAIYDLWKRLDGVVRTDVSVNRRKRAIAEAERRFYKETERVAAQSR
jgi:hypothetical protein